MTWLLMLLVPAGAWLWHVVRAVRGRRYPIASLAVSLACALLVVVTAQAVTDVLYPPALAEEQASDDGRFEIVFTLFIALFAGLAMVPLELLVAGAWAAARTLRTRRQSTGDVGEPTRGG